MYQSETIYRRQRSGQTFWILCLFVAFLSLPALLSASLIDTSGRLSLILSGVLCLLAIAFPLLLPGRKISLYDPLVLMIVSVFIGATLRSIYITYSDHSRVSALMMSQTYGEIASQSVWLILGLFGIGLGYALTTARLPVERAGWLFDRQVSTGPRFRMAMALSIIIVLVGIVLFIDANGIQFALDSISSKRSISIVTDDGQEVYSSLGYIRAMSEFGTSALYYYVAAKLHQKQKFGLGAMAVLLGLFLLSAAIPFLSSSRSEVGVIVINMVVLFLIFGKLKTRMLLLSALAVVVIVVGMAQLRSLSQGDGDFAANSIIDTIVGSGNFVDISRTSAILTRLPQTTEYLNGASYLTWLTAPIPKVMWPDKPNPSLGPWVRSEIFGVWTRNNGWPPNIVAEAFINFGYTGIFFVCFIFGSVVRFTFNAFVKVIPSNPLLTIVYISIYWTLGMKFIQLNFSQGIIGCIQSIIPTLIFIMMATTPKSKSRSVTSTVGGGYQVR